MNGLIIGNNNRIYNKSNTSLFFQESEPVDIIIGEAQGSTNIKTITYDSLNNDITSEIYELNIKDISGVENVLLYNDGRISINSSMIVTDPSDVRFIFNAKIKKIISDYYDDMTYAYDGFIFMVRLNGKETKEYDIVDYRIVIRKDNNSIKMSNNIVEIITYPVQYGKSAILEYYGYNVDNYIEEKMFSSFSDTPTLNEIELYGKKKRGIRNKTLSTTSGGVLNIQLYRHDLENNYDNLLDKKFRVILVNDDKKTIYHNCKIRYSASSVEEEVNNISYEISYGYRTFENLEEGE